MKGWTTKSKTDGVQNVRNFPQTKLDSERNAPFLLNEDGKPHFLFHNFNENMIVNVWKKKQKYMANFLANEINTTVQRET